MILKYRLNGRALNFDFNDKGSILFISDNLSSKEYTYFIKTIYSGVYYNLIDFSLL